MSIRTEIKYLIFEENSTLTNVATELTKITGKKYTGKTLSQKLTRNSLKANEYKLIAKILGYDVKLVKRKAK